MVYDVMAPTMLPCAACYAMLLNPNNAIIQTWV